MDAETWKMSPGITYKHSHMCIRRGVGVHLLCTADPPFRSTVHVRLGIEPRSCGISRFHCRSTISSEVFHCSKKPAYDPNPRQNNSNLCQHQALYWFQSFRTLGANQQILAGRICRRKLNPTRSRTGHIFWAHSFASRSRSKKPFSKALNFPEL